MSTKKEEAPLASAQSSMLTPAEWAGRKGLIGKIDPLRPDEPPNKHWTYAAADALHGWTADAHDYQGEHQALRLSESDFDAALVAAAGYPAVPAHEAACGRKFKDRAKPVTDPHTKTKLQAVKTNG